MTDKDKECRSQREAFEEWAGAVNYILTAETRHNLTKATYRLSHTESAYEGFQAGAAWQQSRLLEGELVERVARVLEPMTSVYCATPVWFSEPHRLKALCQDYARTAIAEIKKHTEVV